jgi:hypothetical protein
MLFWVPMIKEICRRMSLAVSSNVTAAFAVWLDYTLDRDQRVPAKGGHPHWMRHKWLYPLKFQESHQSTAGMES